MKNHLISVNDLSYEDIENIFTRSKVTGGFSGCFEKNLVTLFYEPSTRTRVSFELAAKKIGMKVVSINSNESSTEKGESLEDTLLTLQALGFDIVVVRHNKANELRDIELPRDLIIINAGDGDNQHPTQALIDLFTIRERFNTKSIDGMKVLFLSSGYSRVENSDTILFNHYGANVTSINPLKYSTESILEELGKSDVIIPVRPQMERGLLYKTHFKLDIDHFHYMKKDAVIMFPGPINRNVEITAAAAYSSRSLGLQQVKNGVIIRKNLLLEYKNG